jgi:hypothetical protein
MFDLRCPHCGTTGPVGDGAGDTLAWHLANECKEHLPIVTAEDINPGEEGWPEELRTDYEAAFYREARELIESDPTVCVRRTTGSAREDDDRDRDDDRDHADEERQIRRIREALREELSPPKTKPLVRRLKDGLATHHWGAAPRWLR